MAKTSIGGAVSLYLSISLVVVSSVLVKQIAKGHVLVYFVLNVLTNTQMNYLEVEKCLYELVFLARNLPHTIKNTKYLS